MYDIGEVVGGWRIMSGPYMPLANSKKESFYDCICSSCGAKVSQRSYYLWSLAKQGRTSVCRKCTLITRNTTHGQAGSRLHTIWRGMRQRCRDENHTSANNYKLKGIEVCEEWQNFASFHAWAIKNGYQDGLTIDRIDPSKGYDPTNCQWITRSENSKRTANPVRRSDGILFKNRDEAASSMGCNPVSITTAIHRKTRIYGFYFSYIYQQ